MSASLPAEAAAGLSTRWEVLRKHEGTYTDAAAKVVISPLTGDFIATWCSGDVSLLHLASGSMLGKISASSEEVEDQFSSFDIDPTEKQLLTVSRKSMMLKVWDIAESRELTSWKCAHQLPVLDVAYSPTGMEVASCSADKSIVVYSVNRKGVVTHRFAPSATNPSQKPGHKSRVVHLFWHPNPKRGELVSCAEDGEMRIWKLSDSSSVLLSNHMSLVTSVAFSKDGNTLISGGRDKVVNVWSIAADTYGNHLRTLPVYESVEGLSILAARPSCLPKADSKAAADTYFTTAGSKGQLRTWSLASLECLHTKDLPTAAASEDSSTQTQINASKYIANQVAHLLRIPAKRGNTPSDEKLIAVTQEQNFYIYSASTFARLQLLLGFNDEIIDLKAHPNNTHALMASNSSQIRVMHLDNLQADLISGHTDTVLAIDISPCGNYVVSSSKDNTVRFWKLDFSNPEAISTCIAIGEGHTESVGCVTFSKNKHTGKLFAVSGARERIMKLWDCTPFKTHSTSSPPLRLTALTSRLAHEKDINCLECAPNDKLVASGSEDKTIRVWDTADLSPKAVLKGHRRGVWCIRFSPVDKVLASASGDKTIKLWSMDDFSCLKTLESHSASVKQVMFINAGMQLLSCGDDSVVKLWTIKTSECVGTFEEAHDGKIWAMAISPDQRRVLTGGSDSVINIWHDVSSLDVEEQEAKRETFLLQEQELTNLIRHKQYKQAVSMCLTLEQPRKAFTIVQELMVQENKENTPSELPAIVTSLEDDLLSRLILYIRDWNTHAKTSHVAQTLLSHLFRHLPPARLLSNRSILHQSSNLTLYSERHFNRVDKLLTKSYIMDFMLNAMKAVEPDASAKDEAVVPIDSDFVLKQLLGTSSTPTPAAVSAPGVRSTSAAPVTVSSSAPSDDEEGGFSDDDDAAWATNWKDDAAASEEDEAPAAAPAAASKKRKEPAPSKAAPEAAVTKKAKKPAAQPASSKKKQK